jgi:hypothetical protein
VRAEQASPSAATPRIPAELGAFLKLAEIWNLSSDQQIRLLGSPARSTFFKWKKEGGLLPADTRERISHLLAIHKSLTILFPDPQRAAQWVTRENAYWGGETARDHMLAGKVADIIDVRRYLDAQRGG